MVNRHKTLTNDWDLLNQANHDQASLTELFHRHRDFVYRLILSRIRDHHAAEDVTQEIFMSIAGHKRRFFKGSKFRTWLYRVAMNRATDYLRKHHKDPVMELNDSNAGFATDNQAETDIELNLVFRAIRKLPARQQKVAVLRLLEGLSTKETAQILSISSGSVKTHLHRAQQFIKHTLESVTGETS